MLLDESHAVGTRAGHLNFARPIDANDVDGIPVQIFGPENALGLNDGTNLGMCGRKLARSLWMSLLNDVGGTYNETATLVDDCTMHEEVRIGCAGYLNCSVMYPCGIHSISSIWHDDTVYIYVRQLY